MASTRSEFFRVCDLVKSENIAKVTVYWDKDYFANKDYKSVAGYCYDYETPPRIYLIKGTRFTYKELLIALLHEYGHVLDYKKNKKTKRIQLAHEHDYDDNTLFAITQQPKYVKRAILMTEYLAEKAVYRLITKYGIECIPQAELWAETWTMIKTRKYEMLYGELAPRKMRLQWYREAIKNPTKITSYYVQDLEII